MTVDDFRLSEAAFARLRKAAARFGTQQQLSDTTGIPLPTLQKILRGKTDPSFSRVAALCQALGLDLNELTHGIGPESGDWESHIEQPEVRFLPYYDITVSAGNGVQPLEGEPEKTFAFRADWLRSKFPDVDALALVRVDGDSMLPELRPKDLLMVDRAQRMPKDGIYLVQIGDHLLVKRIQQVASAKVKLLSANPVYGPIDIDLTDKENPFAIIAKAVWLGRNI